MAILQVGKDENRELKNIANTLASSKKVVIITGAGISTNCGIPDFRSDEGLYSLIQAQYDRASTSPQKPLTPSKRSGLTGCFPSTPRHERNSLPTNVKGKDLFDARVWKDPTSTSVFYTFIASLRKKIREEVKKTTPTHRFIRTIRDSRKLVRCYTQNIDGLESRLGLCMDMDRGKGIKSRFATNKKAIPQVKSCLAAQTDGGCEVVPLHGDLEVLRCTLCQKTCGWEEQGREDALLKGAAPECFSCALSDRQRRDRGKRGTKIGTLRPNIVLYGEEHPAGDALGCITANDLSLAPDVLLILGTSLHVKGVKTMVKEFAKAVHARPKGKGKVIFVNLSKPCDSVWADSIDYWVSMDCDEWIGALRQHRPDIWQVQTELKAKVVKKDIHRPLKPSTPKKPKILHAENKENDNIEALKVARTDGRRPVAPIRKTALAEIKNNVVQIVIDDSEGDSRDGSVEVFSSSQLLTPPPSKHKHSSPAKRSKEMDGLPPHRTELTRIPLSPSLRVGESPSLKRSRSSQSGRAESWTPKRRKLETIDIWTDQSPI
ncbi:MAG: hypothetical protein Q9174_006589 [Haloplaca sp. 1 TL-2023]